MIDSVRPITKRFEERRNSRGLPFGAWPLAAPQTARTLGAMEGRDVTASIHGLVDRFFALNGHAAAFTNEAGRDADTLIAELKQIGDAAEEKENRLGGRLAAAARETAEVVGLVAAGEEELERSE